MLEMEDLCAGYGGRPVLEGLCLRVPRGELTVVVGPNGCGKSTLLKAIAGILPAQGRVRLDGKIISGLPPRELARKIAYLPQNRSVPEIRVQRLVLHGRFPYLGYPRRYRKEDYAAAERAMEVMGIRELGEQMLPALSGGQRQKAYIAMVLAQDTPVVLLDEPNVFLDIGHQIQLLELARSLARSGKAVVLVLHDLALALEYADRVAVMDRGKVCCQGSAREVLDSGSLEAVFGVRIGQLQTDRGTKFYYTGRETGGEPLGKE